MPSNERMNALHAHELFTLGAGSICEVLTAVQNAQEKLAEYRITGNIEQVAATLDSLVAAHSASMTGIEALRTLEDRLSSLSASKRKPPLVSDEEYEQGVVRPSDPRKGES